MCSLVLPIFRSSLHSEIISSNTPIPNRFCKEERSSLSLCLSPVPLTPEELGKGSTCRAQVEHQLYNLATVFNFHFKMLAIRAQQSLLPVGSGIHFHWYLLSSWKQDACSVHETSRNHLSAGYKPFPRWDEILSSLSLAFRQAALAWKPKKWETRHWNFPAVNEGHRLPVCKLYIYFSKKTPTSDNMD